MPEDIVHVGEPTRPLGVQTHSPSFMQDERGSPLQWLISKAIPKLLSRLGIECGDIDDFCVQGGRACALRPTI
jgi:hypothetical protein